MYNPLYIGIQHSQPTLLLLLTTKTIYKSAISRIKTRIRALRWHWTVLGGVSSCKKLWFQSAFKSSKVEKGPSRTTDLHQTTLIHFSAFSQTPDEASEPMNCEMCPFNCNCNCNSSIYNALPTKRPEVQYEVIYMCSAKPRLNKTVLRRRLKDAVVDWWSLMSVGRLFQTRGAATFAGTKLQAKIALRVILAWHYICNTHLPVATRMSYSLDKQRYRLQSQWCAICTVKQFKTTDEKRR